MLTSSDRYLVPILLAPFAREMARRLARLSVGPVLEIAAGTGVLTQAIAASMSAGLTIVATDPSADAISHATLKLGLSRVTWRIADPLCLPFGDASFGVVTCHFGIPALSDRVRAFREARRVMKHAARFVFSVPGPIRYNPVAACLQSALDDAFPDDPPGYISHGLHGYSDNEAVDDDLTVAGFTDAIYTTLDLPFIADSARDVARAYCLGTRLRAQLEARTSGNPDPVIETVTRALRRRFGTGRIESTMRAHLVSAAG